MAVETWFPLAVYYEDLGPSAEVKQEMLAYLNPLIEQYRKTESKGAAYTGDTRGAWQLHREKPFQWLRGRVEVHTIEFARKLGVNLGVIGFYFQRSWPVFSRKGEQVYRHCHPNATISGVYYLDVPPSEGEGGRLVFHNDSQQNSLGTGFGTDTTRGISQWNDLNYRDVLYKPIEGRLVLFPSKQPHSVEACRAEGLRISLSFDIALTCSRHADPGQHEFLAPPPGEWVEFSSQLQPDGNDPERP